ncbi:MAG: site-2 protease family protein [Candidatus Altiarchaeota archaeon]
MDPVIALLLLLFLAAAVFLLRSKVERVFGVFFVIRSTYGIRLIESVSKFRPDLWEFLADFSLLISFGGLGGYYLLLNRQSKGNFHTSLLLTGLIFSALAAFLGWFDISAAFFLMSFALYFVLPKMGNIVVDLTAAVFMIFLGCRMFFDTPLSALAALFGLPALMVYFMFSHGMNILSAKTTLPGVSPMLPDARDGAVGVSFPGYDIFIPWWFALIALFVTLAAHEGAHGVLTRVANVRLKSTGLLSFLSLPIGAFVEPDEEELSKKSSVDRMRVFTMGSFANLVVGVAAMVMIFASTSALTGITYSTGMRVVGFMEGYPAEGVVPLNTVVYSVNGHKTSNFLMYRNVTNSMKPGADVILNTSTGVYSMKLKANDEVPEKGFVGVYLSEDIKFRGAADAILSVSLVSFLIELLGWIAFFNINISLVNLLPVIPFDGGRMFKEFISTLQMSQENVQRMVYAIVGFIAVLFIINMIPLLNMVLNLIFTLL